MHVWCVLSCGVYFFGKQCHCLSKQTEYNSDSTSAKNVLETVYSNKSISCQTPDWLVTFFDSNRCVCHIFFILFSHTVDLRKWSFNTATIHVLDCGLLPYCQCVIFMPLTLNKPFSLKLNNASGKCFYGFKTDTLIINRVYFKVG